MPVFSHTSPQQPQMSFEVRSEALPAHLYFVVSAVFHCLGPAFAVLLFTRVDLLGVAWIRIASAALVFAAWKRPWRQFGGRLRGADMTLGTLVTLVNDSRRITGHIAFFSR